LVSRLIVENIFDRRGRDDSGSERVRTRGPLTATKTSAPGIGATPRHQRGRCFIRCRVDLLKNLERFSWLTIYISDVAPENQERPWPAK